MHSTPRPTSVATRVNFVVARCHMPLSPLTTVTGGTSSSRTSASNGGAQPAPGAGREDAHAGGAGVRDLGGEICASRRSGET